MGVRLLPILGLYVLAICVHSAQNSHNHTKKAKVSKTTAHFLFTEPTTAEHDLLLKQLDVWGIQPFHATNKDNPWNLIPSHHQEIDLLWTLTPTPPITQILFPKTFSSKLNYIPGSERLTSSDLLYSHLRSKQHSLEKFNFDYIPQYWQFPRDQAKIPEIYAATLKKVQYEMKRERDWHIYQRFLVRTTPTSGNDDAITSTAAVVLTQAELESTIQSTRFLHHQLDVHQYIEPYLMDGHKFTTGFYVVITSLDPLRIYIYPHALIKIAKVPYPTHLETSSDPSIYNTHTDYIAPWDFPVLQSYYYEFPSPQRPGTNSWSIVKRYLMEQGVDTTRLQQLINDAIIKTIISNRGYFQQQIGKLQRATATADEEQEEPTDLDQRFFQLFRFDFEIDDDAKPWLVQIFSNPTMSPQTSVFGTDQAIKKNLVKDLLNLIGVHPQAAPSFESYYKAVENSFCKLHCEDRSLVYNTACWACPGWFAPYVATRLFDGVQEYARRGSFSLLFPALDREYAKFMDNALSEHDHAFDRYVKSLSISYAETLMLPVFDPTVVCVYRMHCSDHGECINGKCFCDKEYEGSTCYIPKDKDLDHDVPAPITRDSWSDRVQQLWNRGAPAPAVIASGGGGAKAGDGQPRINKKQAVMANETSFGSMMFGILFIILFLVITYRLYVTDGHGDTHKIN